MVKVIGSNIGSSGKTDGEIAKQRRILRRNGDGLHRSILFIFIYLKKDGERGIEKVSDTEYNFLPLRSSSFPSETVHSKLQIDKILLKQHPRVPALLSFKVCFSAYPELLFSERSFDRSRF